MSAAHLAVVWMRLVRVVPTGRESPVDLPTGGLDSTAYPEMLSAAVAQTGREGATAAQPRNTRTPVEGGAEQPGSLAFSRDREPANRALERDASTLWLSHAIGSSGLLKRLFQPPDAENRTSGGVGGWRGAIPVTRPDQLPQHSRYWAKQVALGLKPAHLP